MRNEKWNNQWPKNSRMSDIKNTNRLFQNVNNKVSQEVIFGWCTPITWQVNYLFVSSTCMLCCTASTFQRRWVWFLRTFIKLIAYFFTTLIMNECCRKNVVNSNTILSNEFLKKIGTWRKICNNPLPQDIQ
jgi:hypothetical protein